VIDWLYRAILASQPDSPDRLQTLLQQAETGDTDGLYCLPYAAGERAPLWNAAARAAFIGLTLQHGQADLMRSAVEGILFNAYWIASRVVEQTGHPKRLIASGKLLEVPWIRQLTADLFGVPVEVANQADASTAGAAMLAEIAAGSRTWDSIEVAAAGLAAQPQAAQTTYYREKFEQFRRYAEVFGVDKSANSR